MRPQALRPRYQPFLSGATARFREQRTTSSRAFDNARPRARHCSAAHDVPGGFSSRPRQRPDGARHIAIFGAPSRHGRRRRTPQRAMRWSVSQRGLNASSSAAGSRPHARQPRASRGGSRCPRTLPPPRGRYPLNSCAASSLVPPQSPARASPCEPMRSGTLFLPMLTRAWLFQQVVPHHAAFHTTTCRPRVHRVAQSRRRRDRATRQLKQRRRSRRTAAWAPPQLLNANASADELLS